MPTDTERREVARRLREFTKDNQWPLTVGGNSSTIRHAISDIVFGDKKYHSGVDLLDRLADLIEPSCDAAATHTDATATRDVSQWRRSGVDRDALLALAKVLDGMGDRYNEHERYELGTTFKAIAGRIREACGVEP